MSDMDSLDQMIEADAGDTGGESDGFDWTFSDADDAPVGETSNGQNPAETQAPSETPKEVAANPQVAQGEQGGVQPQGPGQGGENQQAQQVQVPAQEQVAPQAQPVQQEAGVQIPQVSLEDLGRQYETQLAQYYAFSEQDAIAFNADPAQAIPALAARLHRTVFDELTKYLGAVMRENVPLLVRQVQYQDTAASTQSSEFFKTWPELKGKEQLIQELGRVYRQKSPDTPFSEFVKQVGAMAWITLGMPMDQVAARLAGGQVASTPNRTVERIPPSGTAPGAVTPQRNEGNPWDFVLDFERG